MFGQEGSDAMAASARARSGWERAGQRSRGLAATGVTVEGRGRLQ